MLAIVNKLSGTNLVSEDKKYSTAVLLPTGLNVDMMLEGDSLCAGDGLQWSATEIKQLKIYPDIFRYSIHIFCLPHRSNSC